MTMLEIDPANRLDCMSSAHRLGVDLFDDPSWGSDEGKAFDQMAVSGFSPRTETVLMILAIGIFALAVALTVLFFRTLNFDINYFIKHLFDGLNFKPNIKL
jgi:hypothetical protein